MRTTPFAGRWWALIGVMLAVLAVGIDSTVLAVALPTLANALHATETDLEWFSSGYLLALAAVMLPLGLFGDRFGRKRVMLISLLLFGIGSAACAFAKSPAVFIVARVVIGAAGAGVIVMALSALTVLFPEEERPRAVGIWAMVNFIAFPVGPVLGGWLLSNFWWGWVFLMNVPVIIIGLLAVLTLVPESRAEVRPGIDLLGILLSIAGFVGLTYGLVEAGSDGFGSTTALVPMGAGVALLIVFLLWQAWLMRRPNGQPLVDLTLFKSGTFTWSVLLLAVLVLAMTGALFTLPQYFQGVLGTDAMGSGVRLLPLVGGLILGALPAEKLANLLGIKLTAALGFLILVVGLAIGTMTSVNSSDGFLAAWIAVSGLGMGITLAVTASAALVELSADRAGIGSAVLQALQKMGAPLGAAIFLSVLSTAYQAQLTLTGLPSSVAAVVRGSLFGGVAVARQMGSQALLDSVRSAFVVGMDQSLVIAAAISLAGMIIGLIFLPRRAHAKASTAGTAGTTPTAAPSSSPDAVAPSLGNSAQ